MKEIFSQKDFIALLEQENLKLGITRSPKWTMYTRYTIIYRNFSFADDNYEIKDSNGNCMPRCNWVGFFESEDDAICWATAATEGGAQFTNVIRDDGDEGFFSDALLNKTVEEYKEVLNINTIGDLKNALDKYNDDDYVVFLGENKTFGIKQIAGKSNKVTIPGTTKDINIHVCEIRLD